MRAANDTELARDVGFDGNNQIPGSEDDNSFSKGGYRYQQNGPSDSQILRDVGGLNSVCAKMGIKRPGDNQRREHENYASSHLFGRQER